MNKFISIFTGFIVLAAHAQKENVGAFKTEITQTIETGYVLRIPKNAKEKKALIVFLHGSGEKGTDIEKVKVHGPFKYLKTHEIDAYLLAPQCREGQYWNEESIFRLIQKTIKENNVDTNRIYLTGLSLGGWATFKLGIAHPEMFAALVPVCGFVDRLDMKDICNIKDIPTRIYHGLVDDVVSIDYAVEAYKKLKSCEGQTELTIFEDAGHDSWTRVYDNPEIYQWLLNQSKK